MDAGGLPLTLPVLVDMEPSLEVPAAASRAALGRTLQRVTLPIMRPSIFAVFLLALISSLESFEVPLLIGAPGDLHTITTAIYQGIHTGFLPKYGVASAFAVLLLAIVIAPLAYYYRLTSQADRFATITGKGFRPRRLKLGKWRTPLGGWLLIIPASLAAPVLIMLWASLLPVYGAATVGFRAALVRQLPIGLGALRHVGGADEQRADWVLERDHRGGADVHGGVADRPLPGHGTLGARRHDLGSVGLPRDRARDHDPHPVPAPADDSDLRHHLDPRVRVPDPLHALWHAVLPRRHSGDPSRARGMRPHLRRRRPDRAAPDRAAAGVALGGGGMALCLLAHGPRPVAGGPAGWAGQPGGRLRHSRSVEQRRGAERRCQVLAVGVAALGLV